MRYLAIIGWTGAIVMDGLEIGIRNMQRRWFIGQEFGNE